MNMMQSEFAQLFGSEVTSILNVIWLVMAVFMLLLGIVAYIMRSLSIHTIAKRRGIKAYGLAWVPFASTWVSGSIADHFDRETKGRDRKYRLWLLIGDIVVSAILLAAYINYFSSMFETLGYYANGAMDDAAALGVLGSAGLLLAALVPALVLQVFAYIAQYKIYRSCSPKNAVWMLLLAIIFNLCGLEYAIPIFCIRKKDDGFIMESPDPEAEQKRTELYN